MRVLGISAYYHDSAAALVEDGRIVAAAQEERFTRRKHEAGFPRHAIRSCLSIAGTTLDRVDHVSFYDKPFPKFERILETSLAFAPRGFSSFRAALPGWLKHKLFQKKLISGELEALCPDFDATRLLFSEHHLSHAASAFYPSPFDRAAVLTMDGVGEWATTSAALGRGNELKIAREIHFPHSLGLLYSAFTYYVGFRVNSGEYKLMGLAPYGEPRYVKRLLDHVIDLRDDGTFWLDQSYFDYCTGTRMTGERFHRLFQGPPRGPDEPLTQRHMDLAASVQSVLEEAVLRLCRSLARDTGEESLCLAGGVALNSVANGKVWRDRPFRRMWVQPAAGDAGGALGAALYAHHALQGGVRPPAGPADAMEGGYLGPSFEQDEIEERLRRAGARFRVLEERALIGAAADALERGSVLGWFQGRMEFGPRALGNRSILADARDPAMQSTLNQKVKQRESFRPFAPAVLEEFASDWFEIDGESPYMLLVADVAPGKRRTVGAAEERLSGLEKLGVLRSEIPAVTHVDGSARLQTVSERTNPRFHALLSAFRERTGCPVLVNTSFNVRGEPIVGTPEDAFRCFMGTALDALAIGNCFLRKCDQDPTGSRDAVTHFPPD